LQYTFVPGLGAPVRKKVEECVVDGKEYLKQAESSAVPEERERFLALADRSFGEGALTYAQITAADKPFGKNVFFR